MKYINICFTFGVPHCLRRCQAGCKVVLVARRAQKLEALRDEILFAYPAAKVHLLVLDVAELDAVQDLPNTLPAEFADVVRSIII